MAELIGVVDGPCLTCASPGVGGAVEGSSGFVFWRFNGLVGAIRDSKPVLKNLT